MADRMQGTWQGAVLPSTTPVVVPMNGAPLPCAVTLKSADAGRKIEVSTDGGVEYIGVAPDVSSATMLSLSVISPISHVRITGTTNDTWSIR
jgi:hypothetical protein